MDSANCPPAGEDFVLNKRICTNWPGVLEEEPVPVIRPGVQKSGSGKPSPLAIPNSLAGCISTEDWLQMAHSLQEDVNSPGNESLMDCPTCSTCDCDELLSLELEHQLSPDLVGRCVVCYTDRPTWAAWPCGHLPFCELCAQETLRNNDINGDNRPSFNLVTCPLCRQHAYLNRIYLPEDSGSAEGLCFQCEKSKAVVVVNGCFHLSLCERCTIGKTQVKCPVCNTVGQARKIFRPD